jgi:hypothetical protein
MKIDIDFLYLVLTAFAVIGLITWIKSLVTTIQSGGIGWVYVCLNLVASFLVALSALGGGFWQFFFTGWVILALVELGYQLIIKTVLGLIEKLAGVTGTGGTPTDPPKAG